MRDAVTLKVQRGLALAEFQYGKPVRFEHFDSHLLRPVMSIQLDGRQWEELGRPTYVTVTVEAIR